MKATSHLKSAVTHVKLTLCGMLLVGGLVIGLTSQAAMVERNPNPGVIPPHGRPYGLSYGEWGAQWGRLAYPFPLAQFPPLQSAALAGAAGQSAPVRVASGPWR